MKPGSQPSPEREPRDNQEAKDATPIDRLAGEPLTHLQAEELLAQMAGLLFAGHQSANGAKVAPPRQAEAMSSTVRSGRHASCERGHSQREAEPQESAVKRDHQSFLKPAGPDDVCEKFSLFSKQDASSNNCHAGSVMRLQIPVMATGSVNAPSS